MGPFGGPGEMIIVGIVALLLFGKNLPDVAKSLGKSWGQFKKGITDIQSEVHSAAYTSSESSSWSANSHDSSEGSRPAPKDESLETTAPKFEPPTKVPTAAS